MVRVCAHVNCKVSDRNKEGNVKLHSFPFDESQYRTWLVASGRAQPNRMQMFLCSKHFVGGIGPTIQNPDPTQFVTVC